MVNDPPIYEEILASINMSFIQGLVKAKENEDSRSKSTPIAMVAPELKQNTDADTEITKTCAVLGCEDSKNLDSELFFRFPEEESQRQIWADLTGRNSWTPTDYSYICIQHFSVDCFECNEHNSVVLNSKAIPSLKLPKHVLEVEYIDEDSFENDENDYEDEDYLMESDEYEEVQSTTKALTNGTITEKTPKIEDVKEVKDERSEIKEIKKEIETNESKEKTEKAEKENVELLKLFTEVQKMQRQAVSLKEKLKLRMKLYRRQSRFLTRLKEVIDMKRNLLSQKRKKKSRILLSLQDKIREDTNGLVLAMPTRHTDDLKNFALSIYNYSPQAYIYVRNTLRTLLPSTDVLDSWVSGGYEPRHVLSSSDVIKVSSELNDSELSCAVSLR